MTVSNAASATTGKLPAPGRRRGPGWETVPRPPILPRPGVTTPASLGEHRYPGRVAGTRQDYSGTS